MTMYPDALWLEELALTVVPALISGIPSGLFGIASYVLSSMALYTLAKRRGIAKAWLSWVPVVNVWILGSLSDQYRYVVKGQYKNKRKSMLILSILLWILGVAMTAVGGVLVAGAITGAMRGVSEKVMLESVLGPALGLCGLAVPVIGIAIALTIIRYMALYDVYTSMDPTSNVLFLVLSILFSFTECFFLFFSRNKDEGMPPRKQEPVYTAPQEPRWQPPQPEQETWTDKDYL